MNKSHDGSKGANGGESMEHKNRNNQNIIDLDLEVGDGMQDKVPGILVLSMKKHRAFIQSQVNWINDHNDDIRIVLLSKSGVIIPEDELQHQPFNIDVLLKRIPKFTSMNRFFDELTCNHVPKMKTKTRCNRFINLLFGFRKPS